MNIQVRQTANLMARIEELEAEVQYLRDQLDPKGLNPPYNLTQRQFKILLALVRAGGEYLQPSHIVEVAYATEIEQPMHQTISVMICNIRKKLRPHGLDIKSRFGYGYGLDDHTLRVVRDVIQTNGHGLLKNIA